jgi:hypothetical protein
MGRAVTVGTDARVLMEMILGLLEHSSSPCAKGCSYIEESGYRRFALARSALAGTR